MKFSIQHCLSTMNYKGDELLNRMNIKADCLIIDQTDRYEYKNYIHNGFRVDKYSMKEKGISISRENALIRATGDIIIVSDDDIAYSNDYLEKIEAAFLKYKDADMICFKIDRKNSSERKDIKHSSFKRVHIYNGLRYGAINFVFKRKSILKYNIHFSQLFGNNIYSSGEDTLFIVEMLKKKMKVYSSDVSIGEVDLSTSSWFDGYNKKYFINRGALFYSISRWLAIPLCIQFYFRHKDMFKDISYKRAMQYMKIGINNIKNYEK